MNEISDVCSYSRVILSPHYNRPMGEVGMVDHKLHKNSLGNGTICGTPRRRACAKCYTKSFINRDNTCKHIEVTPSIEVF